MPISTTRHSRNYKVLEKKATGKRIFAEENLEGQDEYESKINKP